MERVEEDFEELFTPVVQMANFYKEPKNITVQEYQFNNFNMSNQTVDVAFKFESPFELGLNTEKSDHIVFYMNESYPFLELLDEFVDVPEGKDL